MNAQEFGLSILEYFIANIPTILVLAISMVSNLKKIKTEISLFDSKVLRTENNVVEKVETKVNDLTKMVENRLEKTVDKVDITLDNIGGTVDTFANKISFLENKVEHLFKTNKVAFDLISILISGNGDLVESGIASLIINKMSLTKEELESYPELIATDKVALANAMKEQYVLLGKENFENLLMDALKDIGYGKEN
jgi:restriction endonuclease Mrr